MYRQENVSHSPAPINKLKELESSHKKRRPQIKRSKLKRAFIGSANTSSVGSQQNTAKIRQISQTKRAKNSSKPSKDTPNHPNQQYSQQSISLNQNQQPNQTTKFDYSRQKQANDTFDGSSRPVNMRSKIAQAILNDRRRGDVDEPQQITTTLSAGVSNSNEEGGPISIPSNDSATIAESALIRACQEAVGSSRACTRTELFTTQQQRTNTHERNLQSEIVKQKQAITRKNAHISPSNDFFGHSVNNLRQHEICQCEIERVKVPKEAMNLESEAKIVYGSPQKRLKNGQIQGEIQQKSGYKTMQNSVDQLSKESRKSSKSRLDQTKNQENMSPQKFNQLARKNNLRKIAEFFFSETKKDNLVSKKVENQSKFVFKQEIPQIGLRKKSLQINKEQYEQKGENLVNLQGIPNSSNKSKSPFKNQRQSAGPQLNRINKSNYPTTKLSQDSVTELDNLKTPFKDSNDISSAFQTLHKTLEFSHKPKMSKLRIKSDSFQKKDLSLTKNINSNNEQCITARPSHNIHPLQIIQIGTHLQRGSFLNGNYPPTLSDKGAISAMDRLRQAQSKATVRTRNSRQLTSLGSCGARSSSRQSVTSARGIVMRPCYLNDTNKVAEVEANAQAWYALNSTSKNDDNDMCREKSKGKRVQKVQIEFGQETTNQMVNQQKQKQVVKKLQGPVMELLHFQSQIVESDQQLKMNLENNQANQQIIQQNQENLKPKKAQSPCQRKNLQRKKSQQKAQKRVISPYLSNRHSKVGSPKSSSRNIFPSSTTMGFNSQKQSSFIQQNQSRECQNPKNTVADDQNLNQYRSEYKQSKILNQNLVYHSSILSQKKEIVNSKIKQKKVNRQMKQKVVSCEQPKAQEKIFKSVNDKQSNSKISKQRNQGKLKNSEPLQLAFSEQRFISQSNSSLKEPTNGKNYSIAQTSSPCGMNNLSREPNFSMHLIPEDLRKISKRSGLVSPLQKSVQISLTKGQDYSKIQGIQTYQSSKKQKHSDLLQTKNVQKSTQSTSVTKKSKDLLGYNLQNQKSRVNSKFSDRISIGLKTNQKETNCYQFVSPSKFEISGMPSSLSKNKSKQKKIQDQSSNRKYLSSVKKQQRQTSKANSSKSLKQNLYKIDKQIQQDTYQETIIDISRNLQGQVNSVSLVQPFVPEKLGPENQLLNSIPQSQKFDTEALQQIEMIGVENQLPTLNSKRSQGYSEVTHPSSPIDSRLRTVAKKEQGQNDGFQNTKAQTISIPAHLQTPEKPVKVICPNSDFIQKQPIQIDEGVKLELKLHNCDRLLSQSDLKEIHNQQSNSNQKRKIKSLIGSVRSSRQNSQMNVSVTKTESMAFRPKSPLRILREFQSAKNYVWFAVYDDDLLLSNFTQKLGFCEDSSLPWESVPWKLFDLQAVLISEDVIILRRQMGAETLCRLYLVQLEQLQDIVKIKNFNLGGKNRTQKLDSKTEFAKIKDLYEFYPLNEPVSDSDKTPEKYQLSDKNSKEKSSEMQSIPVEGGVRKVFQIGGDLKNYSKHLRVELKKQLDFENLCENDEPSPALDLIFFEAEFMGLPIAFATNRDQSRLDGTLQQTPSFYKHLKSLVPNNEYLLAMLKGLQQNFPQFSPEILLEYYVATIPGIQGKLTDSLITQLLQGMKVDKNEVSEELKERLLGQLHTQRVFEEMLNERTKSGLHSLDLINSRNQFDSYALQNASVDADEEISRDVVFLGDGGHDSDSELSFQSPLDTSKNLPKHNLVNQDEQKEIIAQMQIDFQLEQLKFLENLNKKEIVGVENGNGPSQPDNKNFEAAEIGVYSSESSQVDNFLFLNPQKFSQEVSREFDLITPSNLKDQKLLPGTALNSQKKPVDQQLLGRERVLTTEQKSRNQAQKQIIASTEDQTLLKFQKKFPESQPQSARHEFNNGAEKRSNVAIKQKTFNQKMMLVGPNGEPMVKQVQPHLNHHHFRSVPQGSLVQSEAENRELTVGGGVQQQIAAANSSAGVSTSYQGACKILNFQQPLFKGGNQVGGSGGQWGQESPDLSRYKFPGINSPSVETMKNTKQSVIFGGKLPFRDFQIPQNRLIDGQESSISEEYGRKLILNQNDDQGSMSDNAKVDAAQLTQQLLQIHNRIREIPKPSSSFLPTPVPEIQEEREVLAINEEGQEISDIENLERNFQMALLQRQQSSELKQYSVNKPDIDYHYKENSLNIPAHLDPNATSKSPSLSRAIEAGGILFEKWNPSSFIKSQHLDPDEDNNTFDQYQTSQKHKTGSIEMQNYHNQQTSCVVTDLLKEIDEAIQIEQQADPMEVQETHPGTQFGNVAAYELEPEPEQQISEVEEFLNANAFADESNSSIVQGKQEIISPIPSPIKIAENFKAQNDQLSQDEEILPDFDPILITQLPSSHSRQTATKSLSLLKGGTDNESLARENFACKELPQVENMRKQKNTTDQENDINFQNCHKMPNLLSKDSNISHDSQTRIKRSAVKLNNYCFGSLQSAKIIGNEKVNKAKKVKKVTLKSTK